MAHPNLALIFYLLACLFQLQSAAAAVVTPSANSPPPTPTDHGPATRPSCVPGKPRPSVGPEYYFHEMPCIARKASGLWTFCAGVNTGDAMAQQRCYCDPQRAMLCKSRVDFMVR